MAALKEHLQKRVMIAVNQVHRSEPTHNHPHHRHTHTRTHTGIPRGVKGRCPGLCGHARGAHAARPGAALGPLPHAPGNQPGAAHFPDTGWRYV
eukprot:1157540-Pelagomonas_calceolata.AAC.16